MLYGVTVHTTLSYHVQVEAESFNHDAEKAVELVKTEDIEGKISLAARGIVPEGVLAGIGTAVTGMNAFPEIPAYA